MALSAKPTQSWVGEQLLSAYKIARRGKRRTLNQQQFERHYLMYISQLEQEIISGSYRPSSGIAFIVNKPVTREIFAAPFRDRVVHHFLYQMVADWWDRQFIYDSYSCRVGKGTLFGIKRLQHHLRSASDNFRKPTYILKLDVQGYFMSLPRKRLYEVTKQGLIKQFGASSYEYQLLEFLWRQIIFDDPIEEVEIRGSKHKWDKLPKSKSLFHAKPGCGIVIGNLTSQLLSNIYLNQLDRFVTCNLGIKHYGRYVDDFYLISNDKDELIVLKDRIEDFLASLKLTLHPKKVFLQEINKGVAFLGAVIYPYRVQIGKRNKASIRRLVYNNRDLNLSDLTIDNSYRQQLMAYHGLSQHFCDYQFWLALFERRC